MALIGGLLLFLDPAPDAATLSTRRVERVFVEDADLTTGAVMQSWLGNLAPIGTGFRFPNVWYSYRL